MLRELLSDLRYRARAIVGRKAAERDLDDELRFHIEHETDRLVREGIPVAEARRRARIAFGNVEHVKESARDARGTRLMENVTRDIGHAFRLAARYRGFSIVVILSLALGIGATAAVFDLTYDVLLAPIAVSHPEQLYMLARAEKHGVGQTFSWNEYQTLRAAPGTGDFTTLHGASAILLAVDHDQAYTNLHFVEGNFFTFLGVRPLQGRLITPDDDASGAPVVVLAEWYAERLFPGDPSPVGRTVRIRGAPFTVIGVTPRSFRGVEFPGWFTGAIPEGAVSQLGVGRDDRGEQYGVRSARESERRTFVVLTRSTGQKGVTEAALGATFQRCCTAGNAAGDRLRLVSIERGIGDGKNDFRPGVRQVTGVLAAGMALVLIVVCCNIASLLLVRTAARRREIAVRLALGASRARLTGQLVLESVPLALLGAVGGVSFAAWLTSLFVHSLPADMTDAADASTIFGFRLGPTFVFALAVAGVCALAFSLYPALRAGRQQLAQSLRLDARTSRSRRQGSIARGVVVAQVAVTAMLVAAASLLASTLNHLNKADGGVTTEQLLLVNVEARSTKYESTGAVPQHEDILRHVRALPGVRSASMATDVPLFGGSHWMVRAGVAGSQSTLDRAPLMDAALVTPGHFATTGIRLLGGREFTPADAANSEPVVIVSKAFADHFYQGSDVVGRVLGFTLHDDERFTSARIVGIAADAKYRDLREPPSARVYVPMAQASGVWASAQLLVRTEGDPSLVARAVSKAIDAAAPGIGVRRVMDMRSVREIVTTVERLAARLAVFVSLMALVLSAVGLYGVVAFSVSQRTSEIGVRIALGARASAILWLVARQTILLVGVGVIVGIPLSLAANGALRSQLYGVSPHDPAAAFISMLVLATIGLVASIVPARRATRVDPKTALSAD